MQDQKAMRLDHLALMRRYGFGPEVMKEIKVCRICGCSCNAREKYCRECGTVLPRETLFDLYKTWHLYCPACGTVVASTTVFCPECGKRLRSRGFHGWRKAGSIAEGDSFMKKNTKARCGNSSDDGDPV